MFDFWLKALKIRIQILIFLRQTTRNDHNRLLYKFENDQKNCGYMPASVNYFHMWYIFWVFSCVVCSLVIGLITYFAKTRKKKDRKISQQRLRFRWVIKSCSDLSLFEQFFLEPVCCKKWQKIVPDQLLVWRVATSEGPERFQTDFKWV